jgi:hypothetical protein
LRPRMAIFVEIPRTPAPSELAELPSTPAVVPVGEVADPATPNPESLALFPSTPGRPFPDTTVPSKPLKDTNPDSTTMVLSES